MKKKNLITIKHKRTHYYETASLIKDTVSETKFYRHKYFVSSGKNTHVQKIKDYDIIEYKNFRKFLKHIETKQPYDRQVLMSGIVTLNKNE